MTTTENILSIRAQFPILRREVNKKLLVYLDNAATVQKPISVIESITQYYSNTNANVHRGVHTLSQEASAAYELARKKVQQFLNAHSEQEIIFTKGTTDGINLVASSYGEKFLNDGDEIIVSMMEHHSNIIPWQILAEKKNLKLRVAPIFENGELDTQALYALFNIKTKLIAITHVSNTLGTINPVKEIIKKAHAQNIVVMVDGAQAVPHKQVDVQDLDADFYVFGGHKIYAPTGIGVLYAKKKHIDTMPPYQGGGGIIKTVSFEKTVYVDGALKFEAGTPNIEGAIALGVALDFVTNIGIENIFKHEVDLLDYATSKIKDIEGLRIIGTSNHKAGVLSFSVDKMHPFDIGTLLDKMGIAVRTGHHCTQPLMQFYGIQGTVRASFAIYNTFEEVDYFVESLDKCLTMLR
jgi:cysteine desulfurase/selenocysteine lyase